MQVSDVSHHSPLGKSDHSVITFNYHCYLDYAKPTDRYNYRKANYDGMKQHLENSNWNCNFVENAKNKARLEYAKARNKVKTLLRKAKRSFERGIALKSKTNPKIFWAHTRDKLKTKPGIAR